MSSTVFLQVGLSSEIFQAALTVESVAVMEALMGFKAVKRSKGTVTR